LKTTYIDHDYGVVIGEYGAMDRPNLVNASINATFEAYRKYYMQYITRSIERHGQVPMYWDGGLFDRSTGAHTSPDILNAIIDTSKVNPVSGIYELPSIPAGFHLEQNYPNPFNPSTVISWQLEVGSYVTLKVYDTIGREVATLINKKYFNAGLHGINWNASKMTSGAYFYRLETGTDHDTKKLLLLK